MKKILVLVAVLIALVLSSCTSMEYELPPMERDIISSDEDVVFITPSKKESLSPSGNYILVRYYSTGKHGQQQIFADLYLLDNLVCTWDLKDVLPEDRRETLYFTPNKDNCPGLDPRNGVSWYTRENFAELLFQEDLEGNPLIVDKLQIWALTSKGYKILR